MKHLKRFGLVALAAIALTAFLGGASASGTVLCTENKEPCPAGEDYAAGTTIHAVLENNKRVVLNTTWTEVECASSTIQTKTENTGGTGEAIKAPVESLSFSECSCASGGLGTDHVTTLENGWLEFQNISGTDDATVTGIGQKFTMNCTPLGTQCIFGTKAEGTDLGKLTGGNPAALDGGATVNHSPGVNDEGSFICGSTAKWEGAYEFTSPKPLHVVDA